jgi:NADH:ubiquinone oxidoreductase subunit 2 (subunit N)
VIVMMYMRDGDLEPTPLSARPYLAASIAISALATVLLGILPGLAFPLARYGMLSLG